MTAKIRGITGGLVFALAINTNLTIAQTSAGLEEIIVTAQRREQSLQDVPISLEYVTGEALLDQGYRDMTQLQNFTPSLDIRTSIDQPSIKIRGVGTVGDNFGFEQSVPMFLDGVHYGRGTQITNSFLDIAQVEVLRGPQPVYFGQNAVAGAISLTTRKPTPEWEGFVNTEYGNDNTKNIEAAAGGPLGENLGIRVAGKYESTDGYLKSAWHGGKFPSMQTYTGRLILEWQASSALDISTKFEYLDLQRGGLGSAFFLTEGTQDCLSDFGMCVVEDPAAFGVSLAHPIPTDGFTDVGTGTGPPYWSVSPESSVRRSGAGGTRWALNIVPLMQNPPADLDLSRSNLEFNAFEDVKSWTSGLNITYELANDITFKGNLTYISHDRTARDNQPATNGPFPLRKTDKWELVDQWNLELRAESATGGFLEWMAGLYGQDQDMEIDQISVEADTSTGPFREGRSFQDSRWLSAFTALTFNPTDRMSIDIGARYTDVDKIAGLEALASGGSTPMGWICEGGVPCVDDVTGFAGTVPIGLAPIAPVFPAFFQPYNTSDLNWQLALRWRPSESLSTYAKYANSFKSGGFDFGKTLFSPSHVDRFKFDDEFADSWELGVKGELLDGRGTYELTGYWSEFTDMQLSAFDTVQEVQRALNVASQRARGLEARSNILFTDHLQMNLSAALLDGEMLAFPGATCTEDEIDQNLCLDQEGNPDPNGTIDRTGDEPPRSPDWQAVIGVKYWLPLLEQFKLSLNSQFSFSDGYTINTGFSKIVAMDTNSDLNLSLGFGPQDDTWELIIFGRNLTEPLPSYFPEFDLEPDGIVFTESTTRSMYRSYGVRFIYKFE